MKKWVSALLVCVLLMASFSALASSSRVRPNTYSFPAEGTVLQNIADREIKPQTAPVRREMISGESPITGLPWTGDYLPMLVQISCPPDTVKVNGKNVTGSGLGPRAPWGGQYADIVFEGNLVRTGETRITFLFSDSFASGQPAGGAGPVRSARIGHVLLREEWQSGIVFAGGPRAEDNNIRQLFRQYDAYERGLAIDLLAGGNTQFKNRVDGVKAPNNYNVDVIGMRSQIPASYTSQPRAFLFADDSPYTDGYDMASTINLDWGHKDYISHFQYDAEANLYLRMLGNSPDPANWAPYLTFAAAGDRSAENQTQMSFSNVIIQRVTYEYVNNNRIMPDMQSVGKGNADIFIGGRYIPGYWVRESVEAPTIFYDDQGNELQLTRGKTFIAHFPPENLLTFQ